MRLIDADELIEHAYRDKLDSRELIANMIITAPTINPSIKKGNWYATQSIYQPYTDIFWCSECNESSEDNYNFCPYCGADMRKTIEFKEKKDNSIEPKLNDIRPIKPKMYRAEIDLEKMTITYIRDDENGTMTRDYIKENFGIDIENYIV